MPHRVEHPDCQLFAGRDDDGEALAEMNEHRTDGIGVRERIGSALTAAIYFQLIGFPFLTLRYTLVDALYLMNR